MLENLDQLLVAIGVIAAFAGTASGWIAKHFTDIKLVLEKAEEQRPCGYNLWNHRPNVE